MKKSLIAVAGASLAVAAMPVVGVFAEGFTDNISVTVSDSCIFRTKGTGSVAFNNKNRNFSETNVAPGSVVTFTGSGASGQTPEIELYCNGDPSVTKTYNVNAKGGADTTNGNELVGANSNNIETGAWVESGATSVWVMSVDGSTYTAVPSKAGQDVVVNANITPGTPVTFNPSYKVYVGTSQAPGTYAGSVIYTLSIGM